MARPASGRLLAVVLRPSGPFWVQLTSFHTSSGTAITVTNTGVNEQ
ncbi:MAG: hypothetical protein AAF726_14340 [Planctomycetota bacterium]